MTSELVSIRDHERLPLIIERCTEGLFEAHGITATRQAAGPESYKQGSCGIVRVAGKQCELTTVLVCHHGLLRRTHPGRLLMRDWVGELANQLAGRVKHALWNHGVRLAYVTPPAFIDARFVNLDIDGESNMSTLHFVANRYPAAVLIDGFLDKDLALEPADVEPCVAEGGVVML
ncbi:MAG: hypothetical protein GY811_26425 [Myxococcales bacterium]|nr:hypothetical protein [Myxococcales bacterium]